MARHRIVALAALQRSWRAILGPQAAEPPFAHRRGVGRQRRRLAARAAPPVARRPMEGAGATGRARQRRVAVVVEQDAYGLEGVAVVVGGRQAARDPSRWLSEARPGPADTGVGSIGERFGRFSRRPTRDFFRS
jgi:hypothetical protein